MAAAQTPRMVASRGRPTATASIPQRTSAACGSISPPKLSSASELTTKTIAATTPASPERCLTPKRKRARPVAASETAQRMLPICGTDPGDGVILFTPVYHAFHRIIAANRREIVQSPLVRRDDGRYAMDLDALAAALTGRERIVVLCSPHNPGGRVWSREEIRALSDFARAHDLLLVADEIHHDLVLPGHRHLPTPLAAPEILDRLVMLTAPTKTFNIAGILTGNVIIPAGNVYIRDQMPMVPNNALVDDIQEIGKIPLRMGRNVYMRDVATIEDSTDVTYGYALVNGKKSVYLPIIKKDTASTLTVVADIRAALPVFRDAVPADITIDYKFDVAGQSFTGTSYTWNDATSLHEKGEPIHILCLRENPHESMIYPPLA